MDIMRRNNIKIFGQADKAIVFGHGYGCTQDMWRGIFPAFTHEYQAILFDHVGAGSSQSAYYNKNRYSTLHGYAKDVIEICKFLDLRDVVFVGHSVSAMIGVLAAIQAPEYFSHLVLVGPSPCYINDAEYQGGFEAKAIAELLKNLENNYQDWAKSMAPIIMGNAERPSLTEELTQSFCRTKPDIAEDFARVTFLSDVRSELPKLTIPSLIMQCTQDAIAPESVGHYLNQHMKGSHLEIMKATGHCPHLSAPEETIHLIQRYLSAKHRKSA